jgi:hypothetical protein
LGNAGKKYEDSAKRLEKFSDRLQAIDTDKPPEIKEQ